MSVMVVMSVYNGSNHIVRQMDSIFAQKNVKVNLCIRDDGSSDKTIYIIDKYILEHPEYNIFLIKGKNEGYAKSFWDALKNAPVSKYYAFSDQDDVWKENKLSECIRVLEEDSIKLPKLAYCNMIRCNENLECCKEQVDVIKLGNLSKKMTLVQTYNYGAATVFNELARELICRCWPNVEDFPHDLWAGMLCYWFGKVYHIDKKLYYWIRYDKSVTGAGTKKSGFEYRIKKTLKGISYPNVSIYLINYYNDLLKEKDRKFIEYIVNYKHCLKSKINILFDSDFRRSSIRGTIILKMGILFNWF